MRALTLRHPWPFAIATLGKRIENRPWKPTPRVLREGDWFAIHGGNVPKKPSKRQLIGADALCLCDRHGRTDLAASLRAEDVFRHAGIFAVARFDGVVITSPSPWFEGPLGWVLGHVFLLPEPIPCKGMQGLWPIPDEIVDRIQSQWVGWATEGKGT